MRIFLRCVAEAVGEHGVRGLVGLVPGGEFAWNVAVTAFAKYRNQLDQAAAREEVSQLARAGVEEARRVAAEVVREVAGGAAAEDRASLELFLTQIPGATRRSLTRPEDPTGKTVPPGFALNTADDVAKLLPDRLAPHRPGGRLPNRPTWELVHLLGEGGFG